MTEPTADKFFWGFLWYLKKSPYMVIESPDRLDEMAAMYVAANSATLVASAVSAADPVAVDGDYTDVEWPDKDGGASSISAYRNMASIEQAQYPEKPK